MDKKAVRDWQEQIRDVLNREWDPIGGCPEDEYYTYADRLASMLHRGASDDDLMRYLEWAEGEDIGLGSPFNAERGRKVVAALRTLDDPS
jgi:hypothetical protein